MVRRTFGFWLISAKKSCYYFFVHATLFLYILAGRGFLGTSDRIPGDSIALKDTRFRRAPHVPPGKVRQDGVRHSVGR
jgi:hypothetical protein